jgi:hypothetical protein
VPNARRESQAPSQPSRNPSPTFSSPMLIPPMNDSVVDQKDLAMVATEVTNK